jgi:hypothetical protein
LRENLSIGTAIPAAQFAEANVTHSFKIAALVFSGLALCGTAFAETDTFQAKFTFNKNLSAEANYANFQRTAAKACRVDVRIVGGLANKIRIETDCKARLMADAVVASGKQDMIALHAARTGGDVLVATAR